MTDNPTPSQPPEPVGDWRAWSADMHARLHPTPTTFGDLWDKLPEIEQRTRTFNPSREDVAVCLTVIKQLKAELDSVGKAFWREQQASVDARADADALRTRLTLTDSERHEVQQTFRAMEHYRQIVTDSGMAGPQGKHRVDFDYLASYLCSQAFALYGIVDRLARDGGGR